MCVRVHACACTHNFASCSSTPLRGAAFPLFLRLRIVQSLAEGVPTAQDRNPAWLPRACGGSSLLRSGNDPHCCDLHLPQQQPLSLVPRPFGTQAPFLPLDMGHCYEPREQLGGGWHCPLCERTTSLPKASPPGNSSLMTLRPLRRHARPGSGQ